MVQHTKTPAERELHRDLAGMVRQANEIKAINKALTSALAELLKMVEEGRTDNPFFMKGAIEKAQAALKLAKGA